MDALTRQIRRSQWLQIVEACSHRNKGVTAKQWCQDHGIDRRQLYYWLAKFRNEAAAKIQDSNTLLPAQAESACTGVTGFVDITDALSLSDGEKEPVQDVPPLVPELMIQADDLKIYVSGAVQSRTLETVLRVIRHA